MTYAFIGGGNMASALIAGVIARGERAAAIRVVEPLAGQRARLAERFPDLDLYPAACADAVAGTRLVVLAVKPQQMREACSAVAPFVATVPVVLSIAAGTRSADISRWLGGCGRIVRAMPNTPALVGRGVTGLYARDEVAAASREAAVALLEPAGAVLWVEREEMLDAVTGVSGSGPAYVFYFLEGLEQAARELGFAPADARRLAYATFEGAIALATASDADPATLRAQVTSKGGTTERAIATLEEAAVTAAFVRAVKAAAARATELGDAAGSEA
jgi:pyrroline-5-carboxylate reductase